MGGSQFATGCLPLDISTPFDYNGAMMDAKRLERAADKVLDAFSDIRIEDKEIMYVAMYCVIKSNDVILSRLVEFAEQIKWEVNNRKENRYVQDNLF